MKLNNLILCYALTKKKRCHNKFALPFEGKKNGEDFSVSDKYFKFSWLSVEFNFDEGSVKNKNKKFR